MLKFFKHYSRDNCEIECMSMEMIRKCNCVQFFMPRDNITRICGIADEKCFRQVERTFNNYGKKCQCLESCFKLTYEVEIVDMGYSE